MLIIDDLHRIYIDFIMINPDDLHAEVDVPEDHLPILISRQTKL